MARGRMINNSICMDKHVNQLSDDTCRLLFTWLVTFADVEGRTYGDAAVVRSMVFPRRSDISVEQVDGYLVELAALGLIVRYEVKDDQYIWFPKFDKNQAGLRKEREADSIIPAPPEPGEEDGATPEQLRSDDGVSPEQLPVNLNELNLKEIKREQKGIENKQAPPPPVHPVLIKPERLWLDIKAELKKQMDWPAYRDRVEPCVLIKVSGETMHIRAPNEKTRDWLTGLFATAAYRNKVAAIGGARITFEV